eukprot:CAMPEP_0204445512 /NCGR_PEP_ID=MMETSP0470-20130426/92999_1 /ASSEMBLY_ACC=CAM_ASM_000385 /TAXON_ID=2969 /ORGANISM="Oxyrrhis marina" /LENGTH=70 /DNA_ID=CAMNT_0051444979 /DNA_START=17 /DNA_END=229 /DNA_ORIENTATION=+
MHITLAELCNQELQNLGTDNSPDTFQKLKLRLGILNRHTAEERLTCWAAEVQSELQLEVEYWVSDRSMRR